MNDPFWLTRARGYLGQHELAGRRHNPLILQWWIKIRAPFQDDETPWCAGFVGGVLEECNLRSSRSAAARSYLRWGQKLAASHVGAIVVFERGPANGHVGFIVGRNNDGNLMVLGGNQADQVSVRPFQLSRVLGYRWPLEVEAPIPSGLHGLPLVAGSFTLSTNER